MCPFPGCSALPFKGAWRTQHLVRHKRRCPYKVLAGRKTPRPVVANSCLQELDGEDLGVPAAFLPPNCVYDICVGYDPVSNKAIHKFGLTEDVNERMKAHRRTYKHMKIVFIISLGEYAVRPAEDTIKYFNQVRSRIVEVSVADSSQRECFACDVSDTDAVIGGIMDEIKRHHGPKILAITYRGHPIAIRDCSVPYDPSKPALAKIPFSANIDVGPVWQNDMVHEILEIERERTKQVLLLWAMEQERMRQIEIGKQTV